MVGRTLVTVSTPYLLNEKYGRVAGIGIALCQTSRGRHDIASKGPPRVGISTVGLMVVLL